jgi:hypothetical protein
MQMQHVLVIELKKGGFELTRKEVNQADGYVQDIATCGAMSGTPFISAWVVGQKVAAELPVRRRSAMEIGSTDGFVLRPLPLSWTRPMLAC